MRPLVLIESPFHHARSFGKALHIAYLEMCLSDSISRGETPVATHKMYTVCLDDMDAGERKLGMEMLQGYLDLTSYHAVYYDLGLSNGMKWGITTAKGFKNILPRSLYGHPVPKELEELLK